VLILSALSLVQVVQAYHNSEYGFSITPPTGWGTMDLQGVVIAFADPSVATSGGSINVVTEETRGTLAQYVAGTKTTLATTFNNYNLVSEGSLLVNGLDCYSIVSTWTQSNTDLKAQQVIFVENGRAYVITCGAFVPKYVDVVADFLPSIQSFMIDSVSTVPTASSSSLNDTSNNSNSVATIAIIAVVIIALVAVTAISFLKRKQKTDYGNNVSSNSASSASTLMSNSHDVNGAPQFCRYCGAQTKSDSIFCDNCGKQLK
jgi:hypothetical protein